MTRSMCSRFFLYWLNVPTFAAISAEVAYDTPVMMAVSAAQMMRPCSES